MNETAKRDRRDEKEEIRYHVIFYGQVQGVGFRYRAYYAAYLSCPLFVHNRDI